MGVYTDMLRTFLYRKNVSFDPLIHVRKAFVVYGARIEEEWIGFASVNPFASPDRTDFGHLWFEDSVVLPHFQKCGVWNELQKHRLIFAKTKPGRIFSCSLEEWRTKSLERKGWSVYRETVDIATGYPCTVLELPRGRLDAALQAMQ